MARWYPSQPTMRQKLFVMEYVKTRHDAAAAYLKIYGDTCGSKKSASVRASVTLAKPHVKRFLHQQERRVVERRHITIDKILNDYQWALDEAKGSKRIAEVIAAAQAQAKLVGLLRERVETGQVGDFPDTSSIEAILETVAREAGPEAAMALASMFGLKVPQSQETEQMKEAALFIADPASDSVN